MEEKNVNSIGSKIQELYKKGYESDNLGCDGIDTPMQSEELCDCCSPTPKYLGIKIVGAIPCFGRNNKCVPINDEHDGSEKEGYQVFYEDGYVSWSPKDVFEKAYRTIPTDSNDYLGILVDPKNGEWDFVGHVAKIELPNNKIPLHVSNPFEWMKRWIDAYYKENGGVSGEIFLEWVNDQPMTCE